MDIILDSNIYLGDIRFVKAGFDGLFAIFDEQAIIW
jgi:hypothetical protein